jgi:hypothetical protein
LNELGATDTLLKDSDIVVLKILVKSNDSFLNGLKNKVDGNVGNGNGKGHEDELFFRGTKKVDGGKEDDNVLVDVEEHVEDDEDFLVILKNE